MYILLLNSKFELHQEYSFNENNETGPSKGIVRRNWPFRMPSFFTSTLCSRETRGVTSLSSLKFLDYCNMCSLQLIRIANKAIGRGFLPLQAKCEEGKNSLTVKKRIDEATDGNILSVKIMHADGMLTIS